MENVRGGIAWVAVCAVAMATAGRAEAGGAAPSRIWVKVFAADGLGEPERVALERAVASGVRAGSDAKVKAARRPESAATKALARGDRSLEAAHDKVRNLDFEGALDLLDWAAGEYVKWLHELVVRDGTAGKLVDVYTQTAVVHYLNGDEPAAAEAIRRAFVLYPELDYSPDRFPPQLEEFVLQERLLFDELGRGTLEVEVTSGRPTVYVNGVEQGVGSVVAEDLPAGPAFVSLIVPGVEPVTLIGEVRGGGGRTSVRGGIEVPPSEVRGLLAGARGDAGAPEASARLRKAADETGAGALVLVVPAVTDDGLSLAAYVYDMRSAKLVGRAEAAIDREAPGPEAEELGRTAVAGAAWQPLLARDSGEHRPSIWKRAYDYEYFWHIVGATAGVVVLGTIIAVASDGLSNGQKVGLFPALRF